VNEDDILWGNTTMRCDECGQVVGTIRTGILNDLVTLALATEMSPLNAPMLYSKVLLIRWQSYWLSPIPI
jgi:hypothetical protein